MAGRKHKQHHRDAQEAAQKDVGAPYAGPGPQAVGGVGGPVMSRSTQAGFPYVSSPPPRIKEGHLIYSPPPVTSPGYPRSGPRNPGFHSGIALIAEELRHKQLVAKNRLIMSSIFVLVGIVLIVLIAWVRLWLDEAQVNPESPPVTTPAYTRAGRRTAWRLKTIFSLAGSA